MARSHFARCFAVIALALSWAYTLPARTFDAVGRFILSAPDFRVIAFINDLFNTRPAAVAGAGTAPIDAALYTRNRHEAGLARLGTVRHI